MNNELLDPQSEVANLAHVSAEELSEYIEWCAQWEAEQEPDWAVNLES